MYIEAGSVDVDRDQITVDVDVSGEVEVNENERISFSVDDILGQIDNDRLLAHVWDSDEDAVKSFAKEHDLLSGDAEITAETLDKFLNDSPGNLKIVMAAVQKFLAQ